MWWIKILQIDLRQKSWGKIEETLFYVGFSDHLVLCSSCNIYLIYFFQCCFKFYFKTEGEILKINDKMNKLYLPLLKVEFKEKFWWLFIWAISCYLFIYLPIYLFVLFLFVVNSLSPVRLQLFWLWKIFLSLPLYLVLCSVYWQISELNRRVGTLA